MNFASVCEI